MVISVIGRIAAKAVAASAKKARAANKADRKATSLAKEGLPASAVKQAEGTTRSSAFKSLNKAFSVLPASSGEKFIGSLSRKQLGTLSKQDFKPLLSQKIKGKVQDALDRFKKPSRQKGGGMAIRGMGAALRGGGMALQGMGAAYKKGGMNKKK